MVCEFVDQTVAQAPVVMTLWRGWPKGVIFGQCRYRKFPDVCSCGASLGTLYATSGQQKQARAELSMAIEMYQAMEMTFWLPEAEATLSQMEGR